jgi:hypothetical protein
MRILHFARTDVRFVLRTVLHHPVRGVGAEAVKTAWVRNS